jgi:hypothetical protein
MGWFELIQFIWTVVELIGLNWNETNSLEMKLYK